MMLSRRTVNNFYIPMLQESFDIRELDSVRRWSLTLNRLPWTACVHLSSVNRATMNVRVCEVRLTLTE